MVSFGVLVPPDAPPAQLAARYSVTESLGFDAIYTADHSRDYRRDGPWFDGWTALTHLALVTQRARVGSLVSNPIIRGPSLLGREALAVDHLSNGRLEIGIGTGIAPFDHNANGVPNWSLRERVERLKEYVRIVDELLRTRGEPYSYTGAYHRVERATMHPGPVQRPRPPITLGGQSPSVRALAAERADGWNTHGPFGATFDEALAVTRKQNAEMDEACARNGRDPRAVKRALLMHGALDPWQPGGPPAAAAVEAFVDAGMDSFVLYWPGGPDAADVLTRARDELFPRFRAA